MTDKPIGALFVTVLVTETGEVASDKYELMNAYVDAQNNVVLKLRQDGKKFRITEEAED